MVALEAVLDLQVVEVAKVEEEVEGREKRTGLPHKVGSKMAQMKPELVEAKKQTVLKKNTPVNTQEKTVAVRVKALENWFHYLYP